MPTLADIFHAWLVHSEPVGSGETTLGYLGRYVNRVALSNNKPILSATAAPTPNQQFS